MRGCSKLDCTILTVFEIGRRVSIHCRHLKWETAPWSGCFECWLRNKCKRLLTVCSKTRLANPVWFVLPGSSVEPCTSIGVWSVLVSDRCACVYLHQCVINISVWSMCLCVPPSVCDQYHCVIDVLVCTSISVWSISVSNQYQQEYIRTRVGNSRSFCYECCHGRIRSSSSLPTSVCTKKGKTFILERWTLYFDEHVHAKCRPSLKYQSKRWSLWRERACTCSALSA